MNVIDFCRRVEGIIHARNPDIAVGLNDVKTLFAQAFDKLFGTKIVERIEEAKDIKISLFDVYPETGNNLSVVALSFPFLKEDEIAAIKEIIRHSPLCPQILSPIENDGAEEANGLLLTKQHFYLDTTQCLNTLFSIYALAVYPSSVIKSVKEPEIDFFEDAPVYRC